MGRPGARLADDPGPPYQHAARRRAATSRSPGLHAGPAADVDYPEERLRAESGAVPGIEWIGAGSTVERLWTKPALSITGLDAPKVAGASNTLVPAARAGSRMRIAPGDTTANAVERLREHLEQHVPWGAELTFTMVDTGEATQIDATGPAYDAARTAFAEAWDGTAPVDMGVGGSIPFIAEFLEAFPEASVLVTGVEDPDTRAHGANEGLHLRGVREGAARRGAPAAQPRLARPLGRKRSATVTKPRERSCRLRYPGF